jgi:hypothetical protein
MSDNIAIFILLLTGMLLVFLTLNNVIRIRARNRAGAAAGTGIALAAERRIELLSGENDGLKGQVGRLEARIAVLERIATDPAERTAREIEDLRQHS